MRGGKGNVPFLVLLLSLLAFARGVYGLGDQSIWWDESLSLHRASRSIPFILSNQIVLSDGANEVVTIDNHPPFYFLILHLFIKIAGKSEFVLRFPSLFFGVLIVPLIYCFGKRIYNHRVGLFASLFGAISPLYLWYIQEVRMYTAVTFSGLLSTYALLRAFSEHKKFFGKVAWPITYFLSIIAMLCTHYLSFLLLPSQAIAAFVVRRRLLLIAMIGVSIVAFPLLYYGIAAMPKGEMSGFHFVPLSIIVRDVWFSFSLGISVNIGKAFLCNLVFLIVFALGVLSSLTGNNWQKMAFLLAYLLIPVFALHLASYFRPAYMMIRHLLFISPSYYLIVAIGLAALSKKSPLISAFLLIVMVGGIVYSTINYFTNEHYIPSRHRSWGEYLKAHAHSGDCIIVNPPHILELYLHYADCGLPWTGLPRLGAQGDIKTISTLRSLAERCERVWLASSFPPNWGDPHGLPKKWLDENAFRVDLAHFAGFYSNSKLVCYLMKSPFLKELPDIQNPYTVNFEDEIRFFGYDLVDESVAGQFLRMNLYWQAQKGIAEDYLISIRVYDSEGRTWGRGDRGPLNSHHPTSKWEPGQIIMDDYEVFIEPGTPPGLYRLEMGIRRAEGGLTILDENGIPKGEFVTIGTIEVAKPPSPPPPSSLPIQNRRGRKFGEIELFGYNLFNKNPRPGDRIWVHIYWKAIEKPRSDYSFVLRLVNGNGNPLVEKEIQPAGKGFPTVLWEEGEIWMGQHDVRVPVDARGGNYALEIERRKPKEEGLVARLSEMIFGDSLRLGRIKVIERERLFAIPHIQHPMHAELGGKVRFLGYDLAQTEIKPGECLHLVLYWQAIKRMDTSYKVFTHVLDVEDKIWGQKDNPPKGGTCPTTLWIEGEVVVDHYEIPLDPQTPPGYYIIEVGMYDEATGKRLPAFDEDGRRLPYDRILLERIQVKPQIRKAFLSPSLESSTSDLIIPRPRRHP